jgi:subfamily B ATP-binding cassette protein MsbA
MSARQSLDGAPGPDAGSAKAQTTLLRRLWRDHVRGHLPALIVALVFMTLEGASLGAFAWLVRPLFDELFTQGSMNGVIWVASLIAALFVIRSLSGFVQRLIVVNVGLRVSNALQGRMVQHMLGLDHRFFLDNAPGALIERVRGDTLALQKLASSTLIAAGRDTVTLLSLIVVMLLNDWAWTLTALVGIPLLVVPLALVQSYIRTTTLDSRQAAARLSTRLDEIFHGIQTIKLNRLERSEDKRFDRELTRYRRPAMRAQVGQAANPALMDLIAAAGFVAVLWFGGQQIIEGEKSLGEFMSFFTALGLMFEPLRRLSNVAGQVQAALASLERIYTALDAPATVRGPESPEPFRPGDIRFDDVRFGYDDAPVLRGLTFVARTGETTALVGPSGAGKTTVFALLTRLADPGQRHDQHRGRAGGPRRP